MMPQIVPRSLDSDMADILTRYLKMENIHVMLGEPITKLEGEGGKVKKHISVTEAVLMQIWLFSYWC